MAVHVGNTFHLPAPAPAVERGNSLKRDMLILVMGAALYASFDHGIGWVAGSIAAKAVANDVRHDEANDEQHQVAEPAVSTSATIALGDDGKPSSGVVNGWNGFWVEHGKDSYLFLRYSPAPEYQLGLEVRDQP